MDKDNNHRPLTVYLLNPISGHGHLDSWARIFTAAFLELGHRVILITQQQSGLTNWLKNRKLVDLARLHVANPYVILEPEDGNVGTTSENPETLKPFWQRLARLYRTEGLKGIESGIINRFLDFLRRGFLGGYNFCTYLLIRYNNYLKQDHQYISPLAFTQAINNCIGKTQWNPDFIFILYLDLMTRNVYQWREWEKQIPCYWGGIQFSISNSLDHKKPLDTWFTMPNFRGSCFLVKEASSIFSNRFPHKVFATLPDVTDSEQLPAPSSLMTKIIERSRERTIVFSGGSLDVRKGLSTLVRVINQASASEFFFLLVGRLYWESFDTETEILVRSLIENPPENVFTHLDFVEDEREFNSLMGLADIIYAVYNNFPYSSNMLSKAAHLERPLIVSDGYEMGKRVKEYGLGITVPEADADAITKALSGLRQRKFSPANFASYRKDHSFDALKGVLDEFLTGCLSQAT
jgi:glycosyltransferase involved in cell wall biosynthesis